MKPEQQISKDEALAFLTLLAPGEAFTFQVFDDDQDRKDPKLTKILHGTLEEHFGTLEHYNKRGAGIFVVINQTNLKGRKRDDILKVRACFGDLDGAPIEPVLTHHIEPSILVESSQGRWHTYYRCSDIPLDAFTSMQHALADTFSGDRACCDAPRVMRLPGFLHQKVKNGVRSEPFMTRIEQSHKDHGYTYEQLKNAFPPKETSAAEHTKSHSNGGDCTDQTALRDALSYIDPEPREDWIKVAHALKSGGPNFLPAFLEWSRGDLTSRAPRNYINDTDVIETWNSLEPNRIGFGAIFNMAKEKGYAPIGRRSALRLGSQVEVANLLCDEIKTETEAELVFSEGRFWAYKSTHWENMPESALRIRVHKLDGTIYGSKKILRVSKGFIDGILKEMTAIADKPSFFETRNEGVNLRNGFVRIEKTGNVCLEPHSPDHRQRFLISQEWIPNLSEVPPGNFQKLLFDSFGEDDGASHQLMLEVLGAAICGINTKLGNPKAFVLHGPSAGNGKSTFQSLTRELLPTSVVACISPADLGEPQFLATLAGCQVNLTDDISSSKAIATDRFKATVTGDPVQAKAIYREPFSFTPTALHIFSANHLPSFSGGVDNGIIRRIVVIPFNRSIPEGERISGFEKLIIEHEGDLLVSLIVQAAASVVSRGHYSLTHDSKIATEQWFKDVDPVTEWFEDGGLERHVNTAGILVRDLYTRFRDDSTNLGITHIPGKSRFKQRLRERIASDPQWDIVRRNKGEMLFPRTLVTKVTKFPK